MKEYIGSQAFHDTMIEFGDVLKEGNFDAIVGINRGGLIPAVYLSHHLGIPLYTITYQLRDGLVVECSTIADLLDSGKRILIVDDICDSGETLYTIQSKHRDRWAMVTTAVLVQKENSMFIADYCMTSTLFGNRDMSNRWIVFPWEKQ